MLTHFRHHDAVEQDNTIIAAPIKKLRLLFYHAGDHAWLYPTALQLKTYIDLLYPNLAEHLDWLIPIQQQVSDQQLIDYINETDTDVLCTSHYLWNHARLARQISSVKPKLKLGFKVIAGGPSIDVNNNKNFFQQYPSIDYAVYGAGEQAFADIVEHLVFDKSLIAFNTSNCAWKNNKTGKSVIADYKFVKMIDTSPFVHNQSMFEVMVEAAKEKNVSVWLPYTLTRGCPYSCTFCDWNSGLGNKVSRRKNTYQQEIDLFQQLGINNIYLADANVGQYDEDVAMIDYFAEKNLQQNAEFHLSGNFSKLKKENNLKIFDIMARGRLVKKTLNFSVQDINPQVLDNINRPDVGWDVHVAMANELQTKYPHLIVKAQLIYGLPGQTPASWRQTLAAVAQQNILPIIFLNEPLPASPAIYDAEYQRKFQYEYVHSNRILSLGNIPKKSVGFDLMVKTRLIYGLPGQPWRQPIATVTQQNILPIIFLNEPLPASAAIIAAEYRSKFQIESLYVHSQVSNTVYLSNIPKKSVSFDQHDLVQMNLLSAVYVVLTSINFALRENHIQPLDIEKIVDQLMSSDQCKNLHNNLYSNWTKENNFYYTIDFSGKSIQIPDNMLGRQILNDPVFIKYISAFVDIDHRKKFLQTAVQGHFKKTMEEIGVDID
jgi:tRNA A37 methylthiotransferase MiaB